MHARVWFDTHVVAMSEPPPPPSQAQAQARQARQARQAQHPQQPKAVSTKCAFVSLCHLTKRLLAVDVMMDVDRASGAAHWRRGRRLRSAWRHDQQSIALALSKEDEERETNQALRRQTVPPHPELFELSFEEENDLWCRRSDTFHVRLARKTRRFGRGRARLQGLHSWWKC